LIHFRNALSVYWSVARHSFEVVAQSSWFVTVSLLSSDKQPVSRSQHRDESVQDRQAPVGSVRGCLRLTLGAMKVKDSSTPDRASGSIPNECILRTSYDVTKMTLRLVGASSHRCWRRLLPSFVSSHVRSAQVLSVYYDINGMRL
jgi:hypothetical protein